MTQTSSEKLFEAYCDSRGIVWRRIKAGNTKTPDYELQINGQEIIAEVKEINPSEEELESERVSAEGVFANVVSLIVGDRVRTKIKHARRQLRASSSGIYPTILVLFDRGRGFDHLDPNHIWSAMYGMLQLHIALPRIGESSSHIVGRSSGPNRQMNRDSNTSISAVAALFFSKENQLDLLVYHNRYARVPLDPRLLEKFVLRQFIEDGRFVTRRDER